MSGDEFAWIASLRPLARGDTRALDLADDAAVIPARGGFDLVISTDAVVEGVHFLPDEGGERVAARLLRAALSDLAAKAAEPFGYLLTAAFPADQRETWREAFRAGLAAEGERWGVALLGGDTVSTPGPFTADATVLGWVPAGRMVRRSAAEAGDLLIVCGAIGEGLLSLRARKGEIADPGGRLAGPIPEPLFALRSALLEHARAAADVSDGLLADASHIAQASELCAEIDLQAIPLSPDGARWLAAQDDERAAMLELATGGEDYALVVAVEPAQRDAFLAAAHSAGVPAALAGRFTRGEGLQVSWRGQAVTVARMGWRHF